MIDTIWTNLQNAMRAKGFAYVTEEETLADRRYTILAGSLSGDNDVRGGIGSGVIRVNQTLHVRVQYKAGVKDTRRDLTILQDQEGLIPVLYAALPQAQRFVEARVESVAGGRVLDISLTYQGQIS